MKLLITIVLLLYPFSLQAYTNDISQNIRELDKQISATNDKTKRAQFYSYKARQYRNNGEDELSIKSYLNSLQQHETGDTWSELGNIYFKVGQYEKSAKVANHMLKNFPAFKVDATDLLKKSKTKLHAIYLKENPPTIIVNSDYFGPKVSRLDILKEQKASRTIASSRSRNTIYSNCKEKWGSDYSMVEYCIKKQSKANSNVQRYSGGIRSRCQQKWGDDYSMVEYCIKKQTKSSSNVKRYRGDIKSRCQQKWGNDYSMVEYCIKKQTKARNNINRQ